MYYYYGINFIIKNNKINAGEIIITIFCTAAA